MSKQKSSLLPGFWLTRLEKVKELREKHPEVVAFVSPRWEDSSQYELTLKDLTLEEMDSLLLYLSTLRLKS